MAILIGNKSITVNPSMSIGKGGEADVYRIDPETALKLFKQPDHPDYAGSIHAQEASRERLKEHQRKLLGFPTGLPVEVAVPIELARDDRGLIVGYTMKLVKKAEPIMLYGERSYHNSGLSMNRVIEQFSKLREIVSGIHARRVVIGDFNDLNVLISQVNDPHAINLIDADSYQFGGFRCHLFTMQFIDPLLCDATKAVLTPVKPYDTDSDWYAFNVMLMRSLLCADPYGGIYRPKNTASRIPQIARPLHRISIFHKEVTYPKPAFPLDILPDDLLQHFQMCFEKDKRGVFPEKLIGALRWARCRVCGAEYARQVCPVCHKGRQAARLITVRGNVICKNVYRSKGRILFAAYQAGLKWLEVANGKFIRDNGRQLPDYFGLFANVRFRISRGKTACGDSNMMLVDDDVAWNRVIETVGILPIVAANSKHIYWCSLGRLMRDGDYADFHIGDTLENQTKIWVGEKFGFGFYRAGKLEVYFVFDAERAGINDNVQLPRLTGQLLDSSCVFSSELCWFFATLQDGHNRINRCSVINRKGEVIATVEQPAGSDNWLGTIRGKAATGNALLSPTDNGVAKVVIDDAGIAQASNFPDTEPFVDSSVNLFAGNEGLYVVKQQEINLLTIR